MKKKYFILIFLIILFIFVCYLANVNDFGLDNMVNGVIRDITDVKTGIYKFFTFLGSGLFLAFICAFLLFIIKDNTCRLMIVSNLVIASVLSNFVLKFIFQRPRPLDMIVSASGYSFPSAHSFIAVAFYGLLIYYLYGSNISCKYKTLGIVLLSFVILGIGISRIYLGVHYPTDVIGGFVGGAIYLIVFIMVFNLVKGVCYEKK